MNHTITIPQKITQQGELIVLPRKQYDLLMRAARLQPRSMHRRIAHTKLHEALEEVKQGKTFGPFSTARELMKSLRGSVSHR